MNSSQPLQLPQILFLIFLIFTSCSSEEKKKELVKTGFSLLPPSETGISFKNMVIESPERGMHLYEYFYNGGGVATGDFNNDGLPDVFFTGNDVSNKLYINKGNFQFEDTTVSAGLISEKWATGVTLVDINADGNLDIYVSNSGPYQDLGPTKNDLFVNNGDGTFTERASEYGIDDASRSTQSTFFDMDNDGDLDLFVLNHSIRNRGGNSHDWILKTLEISKEEMLRETNTLYRNNGNGTFTDITEQAGIAKIGFGLGINVRDFNEDGYLDVYVANDYFIPDFLFINNQNGTFSEKIKDHFSHVPYYAMGTDAADINNDGLSDLVTVDMTPADHVRNKTMMASMDVEQFNYITKTQAFLPQYMFNSLFINNDYGIMSDIGLFAGVSQTDWSWAPLLADFDNDGLKDLFITNGYKKDTKDNDHKKSLTATYKEKGKDFTPEDYYNHVQNSKETPTPNQMYKNRDGLSFDNKNEDWGFETPSFSNGAAYADFDNDGDLDIVVNNMDAEAFVYRNNTSELAASNFIRFEFENVAEKHAKICIYLDNGELQCNDNVFTRGFQSYTEPIVHFGFKKSLSVEKTEIFWRDGTLSSIETPKANKIHKIDKTNFKTVPYKKLIDKQFFGSAHQSFLETPFVHVENEFDDFEKEILLPHKQSAMGPSLAVADVNGDGLEDFYVGGAQGQAGTLYFQKINGHFSPSPNTVFNKDIEYEDVGAHFFDMDGDNDMDLYIASGGGGDFLGKEKMLQDRIYKNDGFGNFTKSGNSLPKISSSTKAIASADFDNDGDMDLFVGGRTMPGRYPEHPQSYLLENNNGIFKDITDTYAPQLKNIGMITSAVWIDYDNDSKLDLILAGEWMPITLLKNTGLAFENETEKKGLEQTSGWWSSLNATDYDGDGDIDLIAGNIGLNNKYHPSEKKPLYLYANDFDENGSLDIVLSKIYKGKKVPVRGKECSTSQMPFLTEKFPTYAQFANADLETIYTEEKVSEAIELQVQTFANMYLENDGAGGFILHEMPKEAQLSPINGIIAKDFDKDGLPDILVAGNNMQTEVETPTYDAGKGLLLKGSGNGKFTTDIRVSTSGLFLHKDVKDIQLIHLGVEKRPAVLVANNNSLLELFVYLQ